MNKNFSRRAMHLCLASALALSGAGFALSSFAATSAAQIASAQTFNYLSISTNRFNPTLANLFAGAYRPTTYGFPFQFTVQRVGQGFVATLLLADDTQYWTGWNRTNMQGNSLELLESDSLTDLTSQVNALGAQYNAAGAEWYAANFVAVPYGNKVRYFQLIAQD